ncbi:MAG TPA: hypothetical protein VIF14_07265 [Alphaproteobacteria bacterium]|jgi:hypothetical protein
MASERDDEDELSWWDRLRTPFSDEEETLSPPPPPDDGFDAQAQVKALLQQPLFAASPPAEVPTLRSAGTALLKSAGLFGTPARLSPIPAREDEASLRAGEQRPPSWKLPGRKPPPMILGDDTSLGAGRTPTAMEPSNAPSVDAGAAAPAVAPPGSSVASNATSPLEHPDARTGLALAAADTLLRKGIDLAVTLAGGNPALARNFVEIAANAIAGAIPSEFGASVAKSAEAAAAETERRIAVNDRATRTRAAVATLTNRRVEAEHDYALALIEGDPVKLGQTRREAIDAWRVERRARGDDEAAINAGARVLDTQFRRTALQHRFAQLDEAGIVRAVAEDEDARADPDTARVVAEDILRARRNDPALAGRASIEREIAERKREGRIDTPEEEAATRYRLRLEAQARRGIPDDQRRLLTNDERVRVAAEYLRIESSQGKPAADRWLEEQVQQAGPHGVRLRAEIAAPPRTQSESTPDDRTINFKTADGDTGRVELAESRRDDATPQGADRRPNQPPLRGFAEEVWAELRRGYPTGAIPWAKRLEVVADAAIRRKELPSNAALHLVGAMAGANPDSVRFAAAHAIARIAREAPEIARMSFEPWVVETAGRIVRLEQETLQDSNPDDSAYPEKRRDILRRVHLETGYILPPEFAAFVAAGAGVLAARRAKQLGKNAERGAKAQDLGVQRLRRDLEPYGFTVTGVKQVPTNLGRTQGNRI